MTARELNWRVISIGALSMHPLWDESQPVRTGHATSTLVRSGDRVILVDPGLPEPAIVARIQERTGAGPEQITDVFLTTFTTETSRGITAFDHADWWIHEDERESAGAAAAGLLLRAAEDGEDALREELERQVAILQRCMPAPDTLADRVDLFPLPGVTPGACGLLLEEPSRTTVVAGDAVPTIEHLEAGKALRHAADIDAARAALGEVVEIADIIVAGRDNAIVNPTRRPY